MEYVPKIDISGLKMMVKSALEKVFLKSLNQRGQIMPTHWLCLPKKIPDYAFIWLDNTLMLWYLQKDEYKTRVNSLIE